MMLEHLTQCDFAVFKCSKMDLELLAGDFGTDSNKLGGLIKYCVEIGLFDIGYDKQGDSFPNCLIFSQSLHERLQSVYEKRGRTLPQKLLGNGVSDKSTGVYSAETIVLDSHNTQIKQNKRKQKETKLNNEIDCPFSSVEFVNTWSDWEEYRRQRKTKLTPMSVRHQIKFLSEFNEQDAIAIIRQSIQNGWTGLFELKNKQNGNVS